MFSFDVMMRINLCQKINRYEDVLKFAKLNLRVTRKTLFCGIALLSTLSAVLAYIRHKLRSLKS